MKKKPLSAVFSFILFKLVVGGVYVELLGRKIVLNGDGADGYTTFTVRHRDAPSSPIRNEAAHTTDLPDGIAMKEFIGYGRALSARLQETKGSVFSRKLSYVSGEFYLTAKVGTPPQELIFLMDTGSELSWIQCAQSCTQCNDAGSPLFQSNVSSTFSSLPCSWLFCGAVNVGFRGSCLDSIDTCGFECSYGNGQVYNGIMVVDNFAVGTSSHKMVFGCAQQDIEFRTLPASGIIGFSRGPFSFATQLLSYMPSMKFSYCLPDRFRSLNSSGLILFGDADLSASLMYIPLSQAITPWQMTNYYVQLLGISVGNNRLQIPESAFQLDEFSGEGGVIFDSGTTVTRLVEAAYVPLKQQLWDATKHLHPWRNNDSTFPEICYNISIYDSELPELPTITFHFSGGADLEVEAGGILLPTGWVDGDLTTVCAAFRYSPSINIIGNYNLQNYWVEYESGENRVGIAKAKCGME